MAETFSSYFPKNLFSLEGRIALVTGGGTGIGLMITRGLAAAGAKVYLTGRRLNILEKVALEWNQLGKGGQIIPLQMDATNKESILAAKKVIEEKDGKLHVLVNNAGQVGPTSPFLENPSAPECKDAETLGLGLFNESLQGWSDLYAINTFSVFFVTTAFLGLLAKGSEDVEGYWSSVINITSISGVIKVAQNHFCYNSAKAAAAHLTKMLATEIALKKIPVRVNAIAPGAYASEMTFDKITTGELADEVGKGVQPVPMQRGGTEEEMAGTALYLASKAGGYTTGQQIVIDGGYVSVNPSVI
ncbi:NAD(P)-binding protein [Macrolepiota fuliginosa MF-IS2]|uniref:NAD(P)-binding protein n=1 Tax=Macrolepiota fuliginosa MF-IS2 TaxID=1400762 RepID=A0A9P6CA98_9AGAR|nr:NAD(P)-binding protein [Macrolepiota fuliginosa MF-IS2]